MAQESGSVRTRHSLELLAKSLELGQPLAEGLAKLQPQLTPALKILIETGAMLGRLDTLVQWTVHIAREKIRLRRTLLIAASYPLFLIIVSLVVEFAILIAVAPMFYSVPEIFGIELPQMTRAVITLMKVVTQNYVVTFSIIGFLALGIAALVTLTATTYYRQAWFGKVPVIGPMFRHAALSEFCHLLAVFIEVGMPLNRAMRNVGMATNDQWVAGICGTLSDDIENGALNDYSAQSSGLPNAIAVALFGASSPKSLADSLHGLGDIYAARAECHCRLIATIFEPFAVVFCTIGIVTLFGAVFGPILKVLNMLAVAMNWIS
jgi:type II secretory pathway component PulF